MSEEVEVEYPAGAIHNGRVFADQLESIYAFKEQGGHILSLCSEWQSFVQCFEHLVQSVDGYHIHVTRLTAENARLHGVVAQARGDADNADQLRHAAESELTKALELLKECQLIFNYGTNGWHRIEDFLDHQPAPAAKDGE